MLHLIELTDGAEQVLKDLGYATLQQALLDCVPGISFAEGKTESSVTVFNGLPVIAFRASYSDAYYAFAPGHATFYAKARSLAEAVADVEAAIAAVLEVRSLSMQEKQLSSALARGIKALYANDSKAGVCAFADTLVYSMQVKDKPMAEACYLLASKIASECDSVGNTARAWANSNLLKHGMSTQRFETYIDQKRSQCQ